MQDKQQEPRPEPQQAEGQIERRSLTDAMQVVAPYADVGAKAAVAYLTVHYTDKVVNRPKDPPPPEIDVPTVNRPKED